MRSRAPVLAAVAAVAVVQSLTSRPPVPAGPGMAVAAARPVPLPLPPVTAPLGAASRRRPWSRPAAALSAAVGAPLLALALPAALPSPAVETVASAAEPRGTAARPVLQDAAGLEAARRRVLAERAEAALRATRSAEGRAALTAPAPAAPAPAAPVPAAPVPAVPVPAPAPVGPETVAPVAAPVGSGYGHRWGRLHAGLDFPAPHGTPVTAVADGVVEKAGPAGGYGTLVTVRHADGTLTAYGHMRVLSVAAGEAVEAGQVIAEVGSEGRSTGPHLHFEVRTPDGTVDPRPWLAARGVAL